MNLNSTERNQMAKKYYPLVCKIAHQLSTASGYSWDDCVSAGNVGLIKAMDTYEEGKGVKKQTFTQYAAYIIRGYILNDINSYGHTIRINPEYKKRVLAEGGTIESTVSLDKAMGYDEDGSCTLANIIQGESSSEVYMSIDPDSDSVWTSVYTKLSTVFNERDLDIFYSTFGINGKEEVDGKTMAKKYQVSACTVTQVRNKIIRYMKQDSELKEMLLDILQMYSGENYGM